ncbi:hypothetical protein CMQ_2868 [Grosmannia clavigera kw1407]|uniref:DUF4048 domain-containing protein n=1 Tax=Grosmannia clavigera (strain kw1407 / UAMH 11150) TaxID=655863 RepID=F0XGA0_GROCL|nr:uncharacterized protein CMQ_2868 [Grosmannia clavigera kw1407]EFX02939.1 hypothetical protein CMQ_2868 [Grosmannia clavigera kw1407]
MTAFLLTLCLTSATSRLLFHENLLIRRDRAFVVASSRRTTSPLSCHYCLRRWRYQSALHRKIRRLQLSSVPAAFPASIFLRHNSVRTFGSASNKDHRISPIDRATVELLFELSSGTMEGSIPQAAPQPRPRVRSRGGTTASETLDTAATTSALVSGLRSSAMPPPPLSSVPMPLRTAAAGDDQDDELYTRPSRSASVASRSNRLSLTLPIALPTALSSRPMPASATVASFPSTPVDISAVLANPSDPAEIITAIAAQERRVLELREDLLRAEAGLSKLKRQWQTYEVQRKRAEIRRTEPMRQMSTRSVAASPATEVGSVSMNGSDVPTSDPGDSAEAKRSGEMERRKALMVNQQTGSVPSTPTQAKRRVFTGRHTRALSLLSPTKTAVSDGVSIHDDQTDDEGFYKSPASSHEPDSPFHQNLSRYGPKSAVQLPKRSSWAPQSVHQAAGLKQVAGDLTAAMWTFVEDLRQATVGDEAVHGNTLAMRNGVGPFGDEDQQGTIRASTNNATRPNLTRAFTADTQATATSTPRNVNPDDQNTKDGVAPDAGNGGTKLSRSGSKKTNKRFSWTPLTVDSYDDNEWSSWDSPPTTKSPRWSGSTMNADVSGIPEQVDENTTSLNNAMVSSSSSPSAKRTTEWSAALNRLTPGNIKRTATDLMKEWEKSLTMPLETAAAQDFTGSTQM